MKIHTTANYPGVLTQVYSHTYPPHTAGDWLCRQIVELISSPLVTIEQNVINSPILQIALINTLYFVFLSHLVVLFISGQLVSFQAFPTSLV